MQIKFIYFFQFCQNQIYLYKDINHQNHQILHKKAKTKEYK